MTTLQAPKISIVCPTYNSAQFVIPTLQSVIAQTIQPFELIISDDGSTDETINVVTQFRLNHPGIAIKILKNKHQGPGATRNLGIHHASGDWIAFLDSDDYWYPTKLALVSEVIQSHAQINFICHAEEHVYPDGVKQICNYGAWYQANLPLKKQLYKKNLFSTSAVVCQKKLLTEMGAFDESLMSSQDYELWLKLAPAIQPYFIHHVLGTYSVRPGNITSKNRLRRWKNLIIIASRYREYVGTIRFLYQCMRMSASMLLQAVR